MGNKEKNVGRNFFDVISEHPKMTFIIFLLILFIAIGLIFLKIPFKIGSLEVNPKEITASDTIKQVDIKKNEEPKLIEKIIHEKVKPANKDVLHVNKNSGINTGVIGQKNINSGINNGIIGDNGTINNNGIQPRIFTKEDFDFFVLNFPDKNTLIKFRVYGIADAEINNLKKQIIKILSSNGYNNIEPNFYINIGFDPPSKITINKVIDSNTVIFELPPAE
jgi:hypothetical protein